MGGWSFSLTLIFGTAMTPELTALFAGRTLPPRNSLVHISYLLDANLTAGPLHADKRIRSLEISKDPTGDRKRDFLSCGAVPEITTPLLTPSYINMK